MSKEHEKSKSAEEKVLPADLGEVILDHAKIKYSLIPLASVRARELRVAEEFRGRTSAEVLEAALRDVISGRFTWDNAKKALKNAEHEDEKGKEKK